MRVIEVSGLRLLTSELGHERKSDLASMRSALPPQADMRGRPLDVRKVPQPDIGIALDGRRLGFAHAAGTTD